MSVLITNDYESEFNGCCNCFHSDLPALKYPCCECKHGINFDDPNYESAPSHYIPDDLEVEKEDIINHPNHYTNGGMECIDEMLLVFGRGVVANFCLCNAWKYRYRALSKNGQEDIDKSHWYIAKYKELIDEVREYEQDI